VDGIFSLTALEICE